MNTPQRIGELSRRALQDAVDRVDRELRDADQEVRDAIAVIRLVVDVPRAAPWYGVPIDPEDSSVSVGVVMRNIVMLLEGFAREKSDPDLTRRCARSEAARLQRRVEQGKREYDRYLDQLLSATPDEWPQ